MRPKTGYLGRSIVVAGVGFCLLMLPVGAQAMTLYESLRLALESNPEIGEAVANREAIQFELRQARGLYLPSLDVEARGGVQNRDAPTTRAAGTDDDVFARREVNAVLSQLLFDGFETRSEVERQASRVDGASFRVLERSEFISLQVTRQYLEIIRLAQITSLARRNLSFHTGILGDLRAGTAGGSVSVADREQGEERVHAARATLVQFEEELNAAKIAFNKLVGKPIDGFVSPRSPGHAIPRTLPAVLGVARENNPTLKIASADLDTARALVRKAEAAYYPKVNLEMRGRTGDDLDGIRGRDRDLRAEVVLRWNLYRGGIDVANKQEQIRRADEERFRLHRLSRDVEEAVRLSWDTRVKQAQRLVSLNAQLRASEQLLGSYTEQFKVGERSLLDLLDTQNTRFNVQVAVTTSRTAFQFAEYRLLASAGILLQTLGLSPPQQANAYARAGASVPPTPPAETYGRYSPSERGGLDGFFR